MVDVTHDTERVRAFGRCATGVSQVYKPTNVEEVMAVYDIARQNKRRVAIRAGGHSFDGQAVQDGDTGEQIILSTECLYTDKKPITFADAANQATLVSDVTWAGFFDAAVGNAQETGGPLLLPGSMQTGAKATAGGTLAGDCLSRWSGAVGKESRWIDSFRIVTPKDGLLNVTKDNPLFYAAIGGLGYLGLVTDITFNLAPISSTSCAHTSVTLFTSFDELVDEQVKLVKQARQAQSLQGISSAWYSRFAPIPPLGSLFPTLIKGGVFQSWYGEPSVPKLPGFPLYNDIYSELRYWTEVMARDPLLNWLIHEVLYNVARADQGKFEDDLKDFIFFMDGDAAARTKYEALHPGELFPITQQTFVVPTDRAAAFAKRCMSKSGKLFQRKHSPSECDMLLVDKDECLMSANYNLEGFAISIAFEPEAPNGCPPDKIVAVLHDLSKECLNAGGRIHLVKNVYADKPTLRSMFSPQIKQFEEIKRTYDPDLLLQNPFSDNLFEF